MKEERMGVFSGEGARVYACSSIADLYIHGQQDKA
jgi:hypothetical protein